MAFAEVSKSHVMNSFMINFKSLSTGELVLETKKFVAKETQATLTVLEALREIYVRNTHVEMGFRDLGKGHWLAQQYETENKD